MQALIENNIILTFISLFIIAILAIVGVLSIIQRRKRKSIKNILDKLEYEKNVIDTTPIVPELTKVEEFLSNTKIESLYKDWKERLGEIKADQIPKITDMLLEADYSLYQLDEKSIICKLSKLEMEIYKVRTNSEILLNEIKEITLSEEKNRGIITDLKATYRDLYRSFKENIDSFGDYKEEVNMQFENIAKRFEDFELVIENNELTEVNKLINAIDEMLKHINVVIEELPSIVILTDQILPKKINSVLLEYKIMISDGYPLDYLNVEYNVDEANKKIVDIKDKCKVLNLEDCLLELKVLMDYFDEVYSDFDKEKINRKNYEEIRNSFKNRLEKIDRLMEEIFSQLDDIRSVYNLSKDDIVLLNESKEELINLESDYKVLISHTGNKAFAFSKLIDEMNVLTVRLSSIEEKLDNCLNNIGNMHDDEVRARQQLEEIKTIAREAKQKLRDYNLPAIPNNYYTELKEASSAIREIIKELDKKPITIDVLNTRVDTARDLVLKLYGKTKEMLKMAAFAEMTIVYGNRYRSRNNDLNKCLIQSEKLFFNGDYKKSLELSINGLNKIEQGIYDKLLKLYDEKKVL